MPNAITLFQAYVSLLDEIYARSSLTSVLDGAPELARFGNNANELVIPKMSMSGLADYSRNSGYSKADGDIRPDAWRCDPDQ